MTARGKLRILFLLEAGAAISRIATGCHQADPWSGGDAGEWIDVPNDTIPGDWTEDGGVDVPDDTGWPDSHDIANDDSTDPDSWDVPADTGLEPDGFATCTVGDLVTQVQCGAGMKCTFATVDTSGNPFPICDVAGPNGWNETCGPSGATDDCQAGYMCIQMRGDWRCRRFCGAGDVPCGIAPGGSNSACNIKMYVTGTSIEVRDVTFCSFHCDPLGSPDGCASGQGCMSFGQYDEWHTDCLIPGTGAACAAGTDDDCPYHSGCFDMGAENECMSYCRWPAGSPSCASPMVCDSLSYWPSWIGICR